MARSDYYLKQSGAHSALSICNVEALNWDALQGCGLLSSVMLKLLTSAGQMERRGCGALLGTACLPFQEVHD